MSCNENNQCQVLYQHGIDCKMDNDTHSCSRKIIRIGQILAPSLPVESKTAEPFISISKLVIMVQVQILILVTILKQNNHFYYFLSMQV